MTKYIMFVNCISGIGGAELYINRKVKYLKEKGYLVYIIAGEASDIKFEQIKSVKVLEVTDLFFPTNIYTAEEVKVIIDRIKVFTQSNFVEEILIESHQTSPALWAEKFSEEVNGVNIIYPLTEFSLKRKIYSYFFTNKFKSGMVIGYYKSFASNNFNYYEENPLYVNIPFDKDEILNCGYLVANKKQCDYDLSLLTISRIEKKYLINILSDIHEFAKDNPHISIKYDIVVSKKAGENYKQMIKFIKGNRLENLLVNVTGPVSPLNTGVFRNQDIFVGMGTSILNASSLKVPSLVIDYRNNNCYGFFGYNHFEFGASFEPAERRLYYYLDWYSKNKSQKEILAYKGYDLFEKEYDSFSVNEKFIFYMRKISAESTSNIPVQFKIYDFIDGFDFAIRKILGTQKAIIVRKSMIDIISKASKILKTRRSN